MVSLSVMTFLLLNSFFMERYYLKSIITNNILFEGFYNKNIITMVLNNHLDKNTDDSVEYGMMGADGKREEITTYKKEKI